MDAAEFVPIGDRKIRVRGLVRQVASPYSIIDL